MIPDKGFLHIERAATVPDILFLEKKLGSKMPDNPFLHIEIWSMIPDIVFGQSVSNLSVTPRKFRL